MMGLVVLVVMVKMMGALQIRVHSRQGRRIGGLRSLTIDRWRAKGILVQQRPACALLHWGFEPEKVFAHWHRSDWRMGS
jgi:hypothetical protein